MQAQNRDTTGCERGLVPRSSKPCDTHCGYKRTYRACSSAIFSTTELKREETRRGLSRRVLPDMREPARDYTHHETSSDRHTHLPRKRLAMLRRGISIAPLLLSSNVSLLCVIHIRYTYTYVYIDI